MLQAFLVVVCLIGVVLALGLCAVLWASTYDPNKPLQPSKIASWTYKGKHYVITTSVWFWSRVQAFGLWLRGKLKGGA